MELDGKKIIEELDLLFSKNEVKKAGELLYNYLKLARENGDFAAEATVLNELVGYHRRTGDETSALESVNGALLLCEKNGLPKLTCANTFLNCATTLKCYSHMDKAFELYERAFCIYSAELSESDYRFAAFYNNYALAFVDVERFADAEGAYNSALKALAALGGNSSEVAVTYCNMAFLYEKTGEDEKASLCLDNAFSALSDEQTVRDGYYAFNCEKCADAFKHFGRFLQQWELEERAESIYENNRA